MCKKGTSMIFKKSKVLTDSIVDFVSGKSLRGHKPKRLNVEKRWNHLIFSVFYFLPKSRNTEKYYGRLWVMCEWSQLWAISLTVDYSWLWADWNTWCYHHIPVHKVGFSAWERTFDPVWVAIPEFSKHTLTLERFINVVSSANSTLNIDFCVFQHYLLWVTIHSRV